MENTVMFIMICVLAFCFGFLLMALYDLSRGNPNKKDIKSSSETTNKN